MSWVLQNSVRGAFKPVDGCLAGSHTAGGFLQDIFLEYTARVQILLRTRPFFLVTVIASNTQQMGRIDALTLLVLPRVHSELGCHPPHVGIDSLLDRRQFGSGGEGKGQKPGRGGNVELSRPHVRVGGLVLGVLIRRGLL